MIERLRSPRSLAWGSNRLRTGWLLTVLTIAALVSLPILSVLSHLFIGTNEGWSHLITTVLPTYLINSFWLSIGVSLGVLGIGVSTAWLVSLCSFPGRRWVELALLLPLSTPARNELE